MILLGRDFNSQWHVVSLNKTLLFHAVSFHSTMLNLLENHAKGMHVYVCGVLDHLLIKFFVRAALLTGSAGALVVATD